MKNLKTTYWLLIVIGILTIIAAVYLYFQGKAFNNYFLSGSLGLVFAVLGYDSLRKLKKKEAEQN